MRNFLIAFAMAFLDGLAMWPLSAAVVRWGNNRFPPLAMSSGADPAQVFPKVRLLRMWVCCVFLAWGSVIGFVSVIALAAIGAATGVFSEVDSLTTALVFILPSVGALGLVIALSVRCPKCRRHLLIQGTNHALAPGGWASIALRAANNLDFRCMYCRQRFFVKPKGLQSAANA